MISFLKTIFLIQQHSTVEGTIPENMNGLEIEWNFSRKRGKCVLKNVTSDMPLLFSLLEKNNLRLLDFEHKKPTLDDLFLTMTGRRLTEENRLDMYRERTLATDIYSLQGITP